MATYGEGENLDLFGGPPRPPKRSRRKKMQVPAVLQTDEEKAAGRDGALATLARTRGDLAKLGYEIAITHCATHGEVCSNDVWKVLDRLSVKDDLLKKRLQACDERWIGTVFAPGRGWIFVKWIRGGRHMRPIQVWTRRQTKVKKRRKKNVAR